MGADDEGDEGLAEPADEVDETWMDEADEGFEDEVLEMSLEHLDLHHELLQTAPAEEEVGYFSLIINWLFY